MSQQIINVGSAPNDGTGDTLRSSQIKANANFTELYTNKLDNDPTTYTPATLPLTGTEVAILNDGVNWVKITWNNIKAQLGNLIQSVTGDSVDNTDPLNPIINAIPLSGTTVGSPVTGTIETNSEVFIQTPTTQFTDDFGGLIIKTETGCVVSNPVNSASSTTTGSDIVIFKVNSPNLLSRGISSDNDFTSNITDLDYVQKKYVDEKLVTNATVTGSYAIDWTNDVWDLTLTGNTTLTETNLPASGKTKTITLNISGNHTLTYPAGWTSKITGAYSGTATLNTITIQYYGVGKYKVLIVQPT